MAYYTPSTTYYQPTESQRDSHGIHETEVFESKANGMKAYPSIPEDEWIELHDTDIDEPEYLD